MYDSPRYPTSIDDALAFVRTMRHGTLAATPPGGHPQVTLLPFVLDGDHVEVHCVQADPTFAAVQANPAVTFFVADFLAFAPHHWIDPARASNGTLHFRAVAFEGRARWSTDVDDVAAGMRRLLATYEPGAAYDRITADDDEYRARLERLAVVRIAIEHVHAKFKLGPPGDVAYKRTVVDGLRSRDEPGDARAADVIESTIE